MGAPNTRDALLANLAAARQVVDDVGLRRYRTLLRARRWYTPGALPWTPSGAAGRGTPVDVETALVPAPRVRAMSNREVLGSGGRYQSGDMRVDKITPQGDGVGIEFTELLRATTTADAERHVMLIAQGGTPWHVREGTDRLLVAGPIDAATAVLCANALRTAYPGHWSDADAHVTGDATAAPGAPATDLASATTLANLLRAAWVAHRADLARHPAADALPVLAPVATDGPSTLVLLHDLLRVFNGHVAPGDVSECTVVTTNNDRAFEHSMIVRPTRRTP